MSVVKFNTQHFRNLKDTSVEFDPQVNVILGNNGSGKSSILEALFLLDMVSRSERPRLIN